MIIVITSHPSNVWDGGDSVITEGLMKVFPEMCQHELMFSVEIAPEDTEKYVQKSHYIIHAGTPSWITQDNRRFWKAAIKFKKHIAMLGIGLALHYSSDIWYGGEDFVRLRDSGLIDLIVCRDKMCYYWLHQRLGFDSSKIEILPCPAFYVLPCDKLSSDKKHVVFSIANIDETSHQTEHTFKGYYEKCRNTIHELRHSGAVVHLLYQRNIRHYENFMMQLKDIFPGETVHSFETQAQFQEFLSDKDVYIGVRNHGALPCGGAGKPALLLGTDYRQYLADEIPFISKIDISFFDWKPRMVMDWYNALDVGSIARSLVHYRNATYNHWQSVLKPVREAIEQQHE
jgi:hypothetical protein